MKKLKIAAAVAAALATGVASAYTVGTFDNGLLVPQVTYDTNGATTAVGLTTEGCNITTSSGNATVYWTFFDENSNHVTDGQFSMTEKDVSTFVWSTEAGQGLENAIGYLVFTIDTNGDGIIDATSSSAAGNDSQCLAGEAFQVVPASNDVAYKVVAPINVRRDTANGVINSPTTMGPATFGNLVAGAPVGDTLAMRYSIANGDTTEVMVWSADTIGGDGTTPVVYTVNMYDDAENRKSVNFSLLNAEENVIDPATIIGRPANFTNGFINWTLPAPIVRNAPAGNGVISVSTINAAAFGARQSILNPHHSPANR